jgi:predicted RNA-binding Zn ribbon-like protein
MREAAAAKITLSEEFLREFLERERSILIAKRKLANKDLDRWLNTLPEEGRTKVDAAFRLPIPDAQSPVETSRPFAITNVQEGVSPAE